MNLDRNQHQDDDTIELREVPAEIAWLLVGMAALLIAGTRDIFKKEPWTFILFLGLLIYGGFQLDAWLLEATQHIRANMRQAVDRLFYLIARYLGDLP